MARRGLPFELPLEAMADLPLNPVPLGPADDPPFLRPRTRTRVRRTRRGFTARAILILQLLAALLVTLAALWTGYAKVMASERLRVGRVEVRGSHFLSEGEVRELLGPAVGENILGLNIEALKTRLRASPWVADATVGRTLPDTLKVEIRERVPLALAEVERLYLMDGDGALIDVYGPRTAAFDLPIVRGLGGVEGEDRRERAQRAGTLLRDLGELSAEVSEVFVDGAGDMRVVLKGAGEVLLMGSPPYRRRFLTFLGLRRDLAERAPGTAAFDLRFRGRIYARPLETVPPVPAAGGPPPRAAKARPRERGN
ncbi:MAG TPA: FtsQ-type POTRA domain-containing protein [Vicinamibacteria bacterium]|jgi:cell division protein FtsQ|nr:FtsQ-type POTRA domain-containing protein [Vicinamibacteria bacterium]